MLLRWTTIGLMGAALLAACAEPDPTPTPTSAPTATATSAPTPTAAGPSGPRLIVAQGCADCHTLDAIPEARGQVGPDLSHVGGRADAAYIRESILKPGAVIATGCPTSTCPEGLMPTMFGIIMDPEEIDALVAYLAGLK